MVKDDYEEDYEKDYNDIDSQEDINEVQSNGEYVEKQDSIDRIFNTEEILRHIEWSMLGVKIVDGKTKNTGDAIATTSTVSSIMRSLRGIITPTYIMSFKDESEIKFILLEQCKAHIYSLLDDPVLKEEYNVFEHTINLIDNSLEMFLGIVMSGNGSEAARQILTGNYALLQKNAQTSNNDALFSVGSQNTDYVSIGRKR
jgi:hypothetical protein